MSREITIEDIKGYLASKEEDEVIGDPMDYANCLAHNTLTWKYDLPGNIVMALSSEAYIDGERVDFPEDVCEVVSIFDGMRMSYVTKAEFRERTPELFA